MPRVSNSNARGLVVHRRPFTGSNTYSRELHDGSYAVFSYGEHWPLYLWFRSVNRWYGNQDKYSRTTSKHASQLRPLGEFILHRSVQQMRALVVFCDDADTQLALAAAGVGLVLERDFVPTPPTPLLVSPPPSSSSPPPPLKRRLLPLAG